MSDTWEDLNGRHFYTSAAWLKAFTDMGGAPAVIRTGARVAVVGHRAVTEHTNPRYTHQWLYRDALREPVEVFGIMGGNAGYESHFPRLGDANPAAQRVAVAQLADDLRQSILLVGHAPTDEALHLVRSQILPGPVTPVLSMAIAELDLTGVSTFDDYIATLTRSNRDGVRRDMRRARTHGLTTEVVLLDTVIDQVAGLLGNVQGHHGDNPDAAAAASYLRLCTHGDLGQIAMAFVTRDPSGTPIAFALGYPWHDTIFMRVAGLDYERAIPARAYFESYFYAPIRYALENGLTRVDFGGESLESKSRRGAQLHPRWSLSAGVSIDQGCARAVTAARISDLGDVKGEHRSRSDVEGWLDTHDTLAGG